jgi:hypothetical protein
MGERCAEERSCNLAMIVQRVERKSGAMAASFHAESSRDDAGSRKGNGVAMVWLRNDLRVLDNEALLKAWQSSHAVLPLYCVDPRTYEKTHTFGFPKTGGKFLLLDLINPKTLKPWTVLGTIKFTIFQTLIAW